MERNGKLAARAQSGRRRVTLPSDAVQRDVCAGAPAWRLGKYGRTGGRGGQEPGRRHAQRIPDERLCARQPSHGLCLGQVSAGPGRSEPVCKKIGRSSCRERVWWYVLISVVALSLKKKIIVNKHECQTN